ncbi:hypothetical protein B9479_008195, partial [Cryptococcus floricola]
LARPSPSPIIRRRRPAPPSTPSRVRPPPSTTSTSPDSIGAPTPKRPRADPAPPSQSNWRSDNLRRWRERRTTGAGSEPDSSRTGRQQRRAQGSQPSEGTPGLLEEEEDVQLESPGQDAEDRSSSSDILSTNGELDLGQYDPYEPPIMDDGDLHVPSPHPSRALTPARSITPGASTSIESRDDEDEEESWEVYKGVVAGARVDCFIMWEGLWVCQEWDENRNSPLDTFCHFEVRYNERICDCSSFKRSRACVHTRLHANDQDFMDTLLRMPVEVESSPLVLVRRYEEEDRKYHLVYSIQQSGTDADDMENQGRRVFVYRLARGGWTCTQRGKGCRGACPHIVRARNDAVLQGLIGDDEDMGEQERIGNNDDEDDNDLPNGEDGAAIRHQCSGSIEAIISHLPRAPPASLNFDDGEDLPPSFPPFPRECPPLLLFDEASRCRCGYLLSNNPHLRRQASEKAYIIYHSTGSEHVRIQITKCPQSTCRRHIGPDLSSKGLVNFNNNFGFSRSLFDSYISMATLSETAIHAFYTHIVENYINMQSPSDFISISTFTRALFAFLKLIKWGQRMECTKCGEHPEVVIMDGTVMHFSSHYLTGNLRPATLPTIESVDRCDVVYTPLSTLHKDMLGKSHAHFVDLRKQVHEWCRLTNLKALRVPPQSLLDLQHSPVPNHISEVDRLVFIALKDFVGLLISPGDLPPRLQRSLRLFLGEIFTPDIVTSLFPVQSFDQLIDFARQPGAPAPASMLKMVTVVTHVVEAYKHGSNRMPLPDVFLRLVEALNTRSRHVYNGLIAQNARSQALTDDLMAEVERRKLSAEQHDLVTGHDCSGLRSAKPRCSSRPVFGGIPQDAGAKRLLDQNIGDWSSTEDGCRKYYEE